MLKADKIVYIISLLVCIFVTALRAQDTIVQSKKNIIKVNLTSGLLYDVPLIFEYERILNSHRSFTIQAGYSRLPFETNTDSLRWTTDITNSGFNTTVDYRFYLKKENKDPAPHGVYLAPFVSFYHFNNERNLDFTNDSAQL